MRRRIAALAAVAVIATTAVAVAQDTTPPTCPVPTLTTEVLDFGEVRVGWTHAATTLSVDAVLIRVNGGDTHAYAAANERTTVTQDPLERDMDIEVWTRCNQGSEHSEATTVALSFSTFLDRHLDQYLTATVDRLTAAETRLTAAERVTAAFTEKSQEIDDAIEQIVGQPTLCAHDFHYSGPAPVGATPMYNQAGNMVAIATGSFVPMLCSGWDNVFFFTDVSTGPTVHECDADVPPHVAAWIETSEFYEAPICYHQYTDYRGRESTFAYAKNVGADTFWNVWPQIPVPTTTTTTTTTTPTSTTSTTSTTAPAG